MKTDQPPSTIGPELRQARIERGITASFVARKLGVSTTMLHDLEFAKRTWTEAYIADTARPSVCLKWRTQPISPPH